MLRWFSSKTITKVQPLVENNDQSKVETKDTNKEIIPITIKEAKWVQDPYNYWLEIDANFQLGRLFPAIDLSEPVDLGGDSRMKQVAKRWHQRDTYKFSRTVLKYSCEYEAYIRYIFDLQLTDIEIDHFEKFMIEGKSRYTLANEIELRRKQKRPFTNQEMSIIAYSLLQMYVSMNAIGFLHLNLDLHNIEIQDVSNDSCFSIHKWIHANGIIMDNNAKIYTVRWIAETEKLRADAKQCVDNMIKYHHQEGSTLVRMKKEKNDGLSDGEAIAICLYQLQKLDPSTVQADKVKKYASKNELNPIADLITFLLHEDAKTYRGGGFRMVRWFKDLLPKHSKAKEETKKIQRADDDAYEKKLFELARRDKDCTTFEISNVPWLDREKFVQFAIDRVKNKWDVRELNWDAKNCQVSVQFMHDEEAQVFYRDAIELGMNIKCTASVPGIHSTYC